jgi:N-acetylglucosamine-6-phosphate deacetylase
MTLVLHSARKLDGDGIVDDFWVAADGDTILDTGTGDSWRGRADDPARVVDIGGAWLTPGFIDLHGHGGGGWSFDDGVETIEAALAMHRRHGTTRSVASLVANPVDALTASLAGIADLAERDPLVLGAHLEGPFLARNHRGAHDPHFLLSPDAAVVDELLAAARGRLVQITIAPELPGALDAIGTLVKSGVVVGIGHTDADLELARKAFERGATVLTHAFNAMPGIKHREPGPVMAAFDEPRVVLELIVDGFHVHPDVVRLAFRLASGRIALITDAMAAAGSVDGDYRLGSLNVSVSGGRAMLSGTTTIAGSTLTQDVALRWAVGASGVDPVEAVRALTATPARAIRRDDTLGHLRPGYAADAVVLGPDWSVREVFAAGRLIAA